MTRINFLLMLRYGISRTFDEGITINRNENKYKQFVLKKYISDLL